MSLLAVSRTYGRSCSTQSEPSAIPASLQVFSNIYMFLRPASASERQASPAQGSHGPAHRNEGTIARNRSVTLDMRARPRRTRRDPPTQSRSAKTGGRWSIGAGLLSSRAHTEDTVQQSGARLCPPQRGRIARRMRVKGKVRAARPRQSGARSILRISATSRTAHLTAQSMTPQCRTRPTGSILAESLSEAGQNATGL